MAGVADVVETLWLVLRIVLLGASFCGLCATVRNSLKINRFVAPLVVVCGIIAVLVNQRNHFLIWLVCRDYIFTPIE